jgi:hypothetical protein
MNAIWMRFSMVGALALAPTTSLVDAGGRTAPLPAVVLYKSPLCGCCSKWADHMRAAGFRVTIRDVQSLTAIESRYGVPKGATSCHTALAGGYVIVGHVPADLVQRLLTERPAIAGISAPGMPQSAPGMDSPGNTPYEVIAFDREGHTRVYERR